MSSSDRRGFVTSDDGIEIFYRVFGDGDPAMVCNNGIGVSTFFWHYLVDHFRDRLAVVVWDYRGHGRSQVPANGADLSMRRVTRDMWTVADRVGVQRPILLGHSMGVQVIFEAFRQRPADVGGLVPVLGTYRRPLDTFGDMTYSRQVFDVLIAVAHSRAAPWVDRYLFRPVVALPVAYEVAKGIGAVDGSRMSRTELRRYMHHLGEVGVELFFKMAMEMGEHDASEVLETIDVPTLVVAAEFDTFTPIVASFHMRDTIPGAEFLYLEGATHAGIVEQPDVINPRIERWLEDHFQDRLAAQEDPQILGRTAS